jgi:hypothetical protein
LVSLTDVSADPLVILGVPLGIQVVSLLILELLVLLALFFRIQLLILGLLLCLLDMDLLDQHRTAPAGGQKEAQRQKQCQKPSMFSHAVPPLKALKFRQIMPRHDTGR